MDLASDEFPHLRVRGTKQFLIIDFYASWCRPCKELAPKYEELAGLPNRTCIFRKMSFEENQDFFLDTMIEKMPTIIIYQLQTDAAPVEIARQVCSKIEEIEPFIKSNTAPKVDA